MIRSDKILTAFFGGVGFRQPTLSELPTIDSDNLGSTSGLYFEDTNALVSIQNIYECQNDPNISDTEFNTLIGNMQKACILEVLNKTQEMESSFIQADNLFPFEKSFSDTIEPSDRAVGFRITPLKKGSILEIPWVEMSFDSDATFNLYLYNSNLKDPIGTKSITTSAGESVVTNLNWYVSDDSSYKGGNFYIVYLEDDLSGAKAYKKNYELSNFQVNTKYYDTHAVSISHSGGVLDIESVSETSDLFGMNFGINIYDDYTELFIRNKPLFWTAIQQQMTEKVLNMIITSTRTNSVERINQAKISFYGSSELGIEGVSAKINRAIKDLRKTLFYVPKISKGTLK